MPARARGRRPRRPDSTCGQTCLHAVYHFFDDPIALERVVAEVEPLEAGGTLAANLARHALRRGYAATIYTYNLRVFDPTWFDRSGRNLGVIGDPTITCYGVHLSPDETMVAMTCVDPALGPSDIRLLDLERDASSRLTTDPGDTAVTIR